MKTRLNKKIAHLVQDLWMVFTEELKRVFRDPGVVLIFFVAGLGYPLIYNVVYWNDSLSGVPVAVIDKSCSPESRRFLHEWESTPDIRITHICASMEEAEDLMRRQKIHGIMYIPEDFDDALATAQGQAHVSLYADMSSFLYMKAVYMSANFVMLNSMQRVEISRYQRMGLGPETAWALVQGAPYEEVSLFCPTGGYSSFLIPAMLIMILHQTLFFGIGMLAGTAREENKTLYFLPGGRRRSVFRLIFGRAMAYLTLYMAIAAVDLLLIPKLFHLPHVGNPLDILIMTVPFLLAAIFFSMTVSLFVRNRETGMVTMVATTLIIFFISGVSWPQASMPEAWKWLSYCSPATWGVHGFLHINTMGCTLMDTAREYYALWILAGVYFVTASLGLWISGLKKDKQIILEQ